jgi:pyroglutamyl-peptidase
VSSAVLPVERTGGSRALLAAVEQAKPDIAVCLGEAGGRSAISIERVAVNLADFAIADNAGHQAVDEPVVEGGPAAYFATLPIRAMHAEVAAAGVPVELSLSAGTYLCNQVMYELLHHTANRYPDVAAGFIHLPLLPEQVGPGSSSTSGAVSPPPTMALDTQVLGLRAALVAAVRTRPLS